jgi:hypothetical protein
MRALALIATLSACAPATATLQAQCAGFGYTAAADIAGCTERGHRAAVAHQIDALRILSTIATGAAIGKSLAGLELPAIEVTAPVLALPRGMP